MIKNENNKKSREKLKVLMNEARNVPCIDCGIKPPKECMEFDHVRGEKLFGVATFWKAGASRKKLEEEIAKCDIRCPNCHRIRHFNQQRRASQS